ncbi:hypothetical protein FRC01_007389, partial [Tulasnella sp. 417]
MFSNNPLLESIDMIDFDPRIPSAPTNMDLPTMKLVSLPRLHTLQLRGYLHLVHGILTQIQLPQSLTTLFVAAWAYLDSRSAPLWGKALASLFPIVQTLHEGNGGSTIALNDPMKSTWSTSGDAGGFKLRIKKMGHGMALD